MTPLPPLPAPSVVDVNRFGVAWSAEQMRAYAQQAAKAERKAALLWAAEWAQENWSLTAADIAAVLRAEAERSK